MNKFAIGKKSVGVLLAALLALHIFHLYLARKSSQTEIVEAVYQIPQALAATPLKQPFEHVLTNRLKLDEQFVERYTPSLWIAKGQIHVNFAARLPELEPVLKRLGDDFYNNFLNSPPPNVPAPSCGKPAASPDFTPGKPDVTPQLLLSWNTRFNPWIKPGDVLSLLILSIALFLWLRDDRSKLHDETHAQG